MGEQLAFNQWVVGSNPSMPIPAWWNGRHNRLKICRYVNRAGSSPVVGNLYFEKYKNKFLHYYKVCSKKYN